MHRFHVPGLVGCTTRWGRHLLDPPLVTIYMCKYFYALRVAQYVSLAKDSWNDHI